MADKPKTSVECRDWPGLITQADRRDVPPGAGVYQVNCQSERPGELRVRRGLTVVLFDPVLLVSVSDSVTVSEDTATFLRDKTVLRSDIVTVSESVLTFLVNLFVNVSDAVTVSDPIPNSPIRT